MFERVSGLCGRGLLAGLRRDDRDSIRLAGVEARTVTRRRRSSRLLLFDDVDAVAEAVGAQDNEAHARADEGVGRVERWGGRRGAGQRRGRIRAEQRGSRADERARGVHCSEPKRP